MNRAQIMAMDSDEFAVMIGDMALDSFYESLNVNKGHTKALHCSQSDKRLISRLCTEKIMPQGALVSCPDGVSSFTSKEDMESFIQEAVWSNRQNIANWIMKTPMEFKDRSEFGTYIFSYDMGEPVGNGFMYKEGQFIEHRTNVIRMALQRDFSGESPLGFYLKSAYPEIDKGTPTDKTYEIEQITKMRYELSFGQRMYFAAHELMPKDSAIFHKINSQGVEVVKCKTSINDKQYNITVTEDDTRIMLKNPDGTYERMFYNELCFQEPKAAELFAKVRQTAAKIRAIDKKPITKDMTVPNDR